MLRPWMTPSFSRAVAAARPARGSCGRYASAAATRCRSTSWRSRAGVPYSTVRTSPSAGTRCWSAPAAATRNSGPATLLPSVSRGGWQANLSARICRGCGAGAWACVPDAVHYPEDFDDGKASPRACVRCQGPQWLVALEDVLDQGDQRSVSPRRVTNETRFWILDFGGGGRFVGDVCKRCLTFEWYGLELDKLRENPKRGVSRLVRGLPAGGGSGPYR